jgi:hypothetical protein
MTATISRLYNNYADAREAVRNLEAAGVGHNDINIIASNADCPPSALVRQIGWVSGHWAGRASCR